MPQFKLKRPLATNVSADLNDIINAKMALSRLGYYRQPPDGIFRDWVDKEVFDAIRKFQKDNGLKVDRLIRPGGPTETAINRRLSSGMPRRADLAALEQPTMCACTSSDDNPWPS